MLDAAVRDNTGDCWHKPAIKGWLAISYFECMFGLTTGGEGSYGLDRDRAVKWMEGNCLALFTG
jgi:hypothetical protein